MSEPTLHVFLCPKLCWEPSKNWLNRSLAPVDLPTKKVSLTPAEVEIELDTLEFINLQMLAQTDAGHTGRRVVDAKDPWYRNSATPWNLS